MSRFEVLSKQSWKILEAFAPVLITKKLLENVSLEKAHFKERILFSLTHCSPQLRFTLILVLWIFQWEAFFRYLRPFTRLSDEQKNRYLKKWSDSRSYWRYLLFRPLHVFVYAAYYSNHEISAALGFTEPHDGRKMFPQKVEGILAIPDRDTEISVEVCGIGSGAGGADSCTSTSQG